MRGENDGTVKGKKDSGNRILTDKLSRRLKRVSNGSWAEYFSEDPFTNVKITKTGGARDRAPPYFPESEGGKSIANRLKKERITRSFFYCIRFRRFVVKLTHSLHGVCFAWAGIVGLVCVINCFGYFAQWKKMAKYYKVFYEICLRFMIVLVE